MKQYPVSVEGDTADLQTIATERKIRLPRRDINSVSQVN